MRIDLYLGLTAKHARIAVCHCSAEFPRDTGESALIAVAMHLADCPHAPYILGRGVGE